MRCTPREMHAHEVHACEMHVYEVHAHEMHTCEIHAYEMQMTPIRYTPMRHMPLRCTPMGCTPMGCTPMRYTPPIRYTPLRYMPVRCTPARCTSPRSSLPVNVYEVYGNLACYPPYYNATTELCLRPISPPIVPPDTSRPITLSLCQRTSITSVSQTAGNLLRTGMTLRKGMPGTTSKNIQT
jgi:hypothetical protein